MQQLGGVSQPKDPKSLASDTARAALNYHRHLNKSKNAIFEHFERQSLKEIFTLLKWKNCCGHNFLASAEVIAYKVKQSTHFGNSEIFKEKKHIFSGQTC